MKKAFIILLCVLAVFAIVSCKNEPKPEPEPAPVETFTVTFNTGEDGPAVESAKVAKGATATKPTATKEGFYVAGWFTEAGCENEYNFATPVTADITLYAKWARALVQLSVKEGMDNLQKSEREKYQLNIDLRDAMGEEAGLKSGDVLTLKIRSNRDFYDYDVRTNKKALPDKKIDIRWVYEGEGDTSHFIVSEPDAAGWSTVTYTFGTTVQRDRWTPESSEIKRDKQEGYAGPAYTTEQYYNIGLNFRGYLLKDDVLEIKDVALTRSETTYELPLKASYNAASFIDYAEVEDHEWTVADTNAVLYADGEVVYNGTYHVEAVALNGFATGLSEEGYSFKYYSDKGKTAEINIATTAITEDTIIYFTKTAN